MPDKSLRRYTIIMATQYEPYHVSQAGWPADAAGQIGLGYTIAAYSLIHVIIGLHVAIDIGHTG